MESTGNLQKWTCFAIASDQTSSGNFWEFDTGFLIYLQKQKKQNIEAYIEAILILS